MQPKIHYYHGDVIATKVTVAVMEIFIVGVPTLVLLKRYNALYVLYVVYNAANVCYYNAMMLYVCVTATLQYGMYVNATL